VAIIKPYHTQLQVIAVLHAACIFAESETKGYTSHREGR
jgi:hypothetical protein